MSKKKVRVELRKNRTKPPRVNDVTRDFQGDADLVGDAESGERVRAKGNLSRHRTVMQDGAEVGQRSIVEGECFAGRVLRVHGLHVYVEADSPSPLGEKVTDQPTIYRCTIRRMLKSLSTDERGVVTTGDRVWVRPDPQAKEPEGTIERVEPRHGVLTRESRRREHVLVANVDQLVIVMSLVQPDLKPHLIDRYIASADKGGLTPVLCLNKADLVDIAEYQPLIGAYSQLGIATHITSARTGYGIERLRKQLGGRATVFSGQSGVGKSSLLNAVQPELALRVKTVSEKTQKGSHTTTAAELIRLDFGGWVVDTPGVRQLQLWDTRPEEVEGYFREFHAYVPLCGFPDCTHTHETKCAVLAAVQRRHISPRRYQSYIGLFNGLEE